MSTDASRGAAAAGTSPESRLEASRQALRAAMLPRPAGPDARLPVHDSSLPSRIGTLLSHPVLAVLRDGVLRWWHRRPWRPAVVIGAEMASKALVPLARRHPGRLVGGAMVAGALLSRLGPWKWIARKTAPALLASVLPVVVSRLAGRVSLSGLLQAAGLAPSPASSPAFQGMPPAAPVPPAGASASVPVGATDSDARR